MKLLSYEFAEEFWSFSKVEMGIVNLLVGDTGSGKTRFLNTIFNLGSIVNGKRPLAGPCHWKLTFEIQGKLYGWDIKSVKSTNNIISIEREHIWTTSGAKKETIINRTSNSFRYKDKELPKLPGESLSVSLLKEEELIKPLYKGVGRILRRNFFSDALMAVMPTTISDPKALEKPVDDIDSLPLDYPVNIKLYLLKRHFSKTYNKICEQFVSVFPFIKDFDIKDFSELFHGVSVPGPTPVLCIKEKNVNKWIDAGQLSSGMQKVLLILTDIFTLPKGSIYLIDEYENSLGISAIDFFPSFLTSFEGGIQFIITSHHPYLINNIPVENWLVFHRSGSKVSIRYGAINVKTYGKSKQQRFVQLINDPFYSEGNK